MKKRNPKLYRSELQKVRERWAANHRARLRQTDTSFAGRWNMVREHVDYAREEARIMQQPLPRSGKALQFLFFFATIAADWGFRKLARWLGAFAMKETLR